MSLNLLPQAERLLSGTLSEQINDSVTQFDVSNPPDSAKLPTFFEIDPDSQDNRETVRVVDVSGNTITVERGVYNGGVGTDHDSNTPYKQKITQKHWDAIVDAVQSGWLTEDESFALAKVDSNTFTITGVDRTAFMTAGRRLRLNGSIYVTVASSSYGAGATTVNINETTVPTTVSSLEYAIEPEGATDSLALVTSVQNSTYVYAADGGASDTYAVTLNPVPAGYIAGMIVTFKANTANTGPCSLNVNTLGDIAIKKFKDKDLDTGDIVAGQIVTVVYDGTNFQLQTDAGTSKTAVCIITVFGGETDMATGDGKAYFTVPEELNGWNLISVHGRNITAGTTGTNDIQVRNVTDSQDMLSTKLTIDSTETGSDTAATPAVVDTAHDDVATNDLIAIDCDAIQTTPAKGYIIRLRFNKP